MSNLGSGGRSINQTTQTKKKDDLSESNMLVNKTLLNIAHSYGSIFDVKSWYSILETLQKVDMDINKKL